MPSPLSPTTPLARSIEPATPVAPPSPKAIDRPGAPGGRGRGWRSTLGRVLRGVILGAIGLEAIYLVGANALFATKKLERWISNDYGTFQLRYERLWTWVPGRYHVRDLTIQSRGQGVQWILGIDQASFTTNPLTLVRRHFDVSKVEATGVVFRLRTTEPPEKRSREELAEFPPIPDFPDLNPVPLEPPTPLDELWTVAIRNIDAHAKELWFQQFRHAGDARARGKFMLTPGLFFSVGPASIEFLSGQVTAGPRVVASSLTGWAKAMIEPTSIIDPGRTSVFPEVDMQVSLDAQVPGFESWQSFLPDRVRLTDGSGQVKVRATMTRGLLLEGSRVSYETERLTVHAGETTAVGEIKGEWAVRERSESSRLALDVPSASMTRKGYKGAGSPRLSALHADVITGPLDAAGSWDVRRAHASLGALEAPDVRYFNVDELARTGLVLEQGVARASASATIEAPDITSADVKLTVESLTARHEGDQGHAEVAFFAHLPPSSMAKGLQIGEARLDLRDVFARAKGKEIKQWWARVDMSNARLSVSPTPGIRGPITVQAKDASPALAFALDPGGIEGLLRDHLNTDALKVQATVATIPGGLDVRLPAVEGGPYQLSGRLLMRSDDNCGAFLVERDPLSVGIKVTARGASFRPLAGRDWLESSIGGLADGQVPGCSVDLRPSISAPTFGARPPARERSTGDPR